MSGVDRYLDAAERPNTQRTYAAAVRHFEVAWRGFLPATPQSIADYLVHYAEKQAYSTLRLRCAALSRWHVDQGFPDPTKTPHVKKVLKGIRELHPAESKQAEPIKIEQLRRLVDYLEYSLAEAYARDQRADWLRGLRDRAMVLIGFWRAFRSDELCRIAVEHIVVEPGAGMRIYLSRSKGDREAVGKTYRAPALRALCPVSAYQDWIAASGLTSGPVFRAIDRWGNVGEKGLHPLSIIPLLRDLLKGAGIKNTEAYSSHSLRRGFATWANRNEWDLKQMMEYVGWKDYKSALRYVEGYVDTHTPFGEFALLPGK